MPIMYIVILVIVALIIIFLYFIEPLITRQKLKNNNEHGSARWATKKEIDEKFRKEEVSHIVKSGFDLPKKNCPECNSILFGDGHNLNYKNTFNRELDCIDIRTCEEGVKLATQIIKEEYDALPIISSDKTYRWCFNPGKKLYEILKDVDNPEEYYGIEKYFETNDYKMILDYERVLLISDGLVNELYELSRDRQISINDIPIYKSQIFKNDRVYVDNYRINIDIPDLIKNDDSKDKSFYNLVRSGVNPWDAYVPNIPNYGAKNKCFF